MNRLKFVLLLAAAGCTIQRPVIVKYSGEINPAGNYYATRWFDKAGNIYIFRTFTPQKIGADSVIILKKYTKLHKFKVR
jgi:hypothetical protein